MKEGWEIKDLGSVCHVQRGLTYSGKDTVDISDQVVLRATNIDLGTGKLIFDELKYLREDLKIKPIYTLKKDSLLICFSSGSKSHLGKIALVDDDYPNFYFGGFIGQITPSDKVESKYLFYCLSSESYKDYISNLKDGVNINNLKATDLKAFPIPLLPLPEQQRIVSILDQAFAAIDKAKANAEQNLQNAKELFESYLQGMFKNGDWEIKVLNEITEVKDGTHDSPKYIKEGIPFVTQKNIKPDGLTLADTKFITDKDHKKFYKRSNVTYGDILISMIGANRGMAAIVDDKRTFSIKNVGLIKESELVNMSFLLYYLKSPNAQKYVADSSNGGAQEFVGLRALRSFPIPLPPLDIQNKLVEQLDALRAETQKLEAIYQKKIDDLEELKKSILQKAFAGELFETAGESPQTKHYGLQEESFSLAAEPDMAKSRRDEKIIEKITNDYKKIPKG